MAIFSWNGASNLDLKQLGQSFDFRSDVLQVSDPSLQAQQFDIVEVGTDLAIVKARDTSGAPLPAADVTYAYIPNMLIRQIGGTEDGPVSANIVLSNGGQLWVGDRLTDTLLDDAGNNVTALSSALQSVQVWGLGGADTISTGDGNDRVYGNTGADSITGGAGNDSLYGGQENDTVSGGSGNDNVAGDLGNDQLNGGSGNDIVYGGAGNDVIDPDTGNDTIFAGNGNDTVTVGDSDTGDKLIYMDKLQDEVNIVSTTGDHQVFLGENNDVAYLEANSGDIQVFGEAGNDSIYAQNSGSDTLDGGNDDDDIEVGSGSIGDKTLIGGFGDDEIYVGDSSGNAFLQIQPNTHATVSGGEGDDFVELQRGLFITDAIDGGADDDLFWLYGPTVLTLRDKSIENVETVGFSDDHDSVIFADGNNVKVAEGWESDDYLDASRETSAAYTLHGGAEVDYLGFDGHDTLIGGAGKDTLIGGPGEDLLRGNAGADQFLYGDSTQGGDWISDFTGNLDRMVFNGNGFGEVSAIDGYKGTAGDSATANDNLLIATGDGYAGIGDFATFLSDGAADTDKPGFYIFFNSVSNHGEIYFDESMTSTLGAVLVATFCNITAANQLSQFNEGPTGGNSGDFVIL